jgi:hypothetical protein
MTAIIRFKVSNNSGSCLGSGNGTALTLTQAANGDILYQSNVVGSVTIYYIDGATGSFVLTIAGAAADPPSLPTIAYSVISASTPGSGGCTWSTNDGTMTITFGAPDIVSAGIWELSSKMPPVPLTVKVKRQGSDFASMDCSTWD